MVIGYLSLLKPRYFSIRKLYLFRCLFPSWKFYEDICYQPLLYYRLADDGKNFQQWQLCIEKLDRSWNKLFLNSNANLVHAYGSLVQQLENDKEEIEEGREKDLVSSVSYKLVKNLVEDRIKDQAKFFQFKLTLTMQGLPQDNADILVSIVHEVQ